MKFKLTRPPHHHNHHNNNNNTNPPNRGPPKTKPTPEALAASSAWQTHSTPIAFISGPHDASPAYFTTHYLPLIQNAITQGHLFLLGPSTGIDTLALSHLARSRIPIARVRVYLNTQEETRLRGEFRRFEEAGGVVVVVKGGGGERDEMMTRASHYDILRYRTEEECREMYGEKYRERVGAAERNEIRRKAGIGLPYPVQPQPHAYTQVSEKE